MEKPLALESTDAELILASIEDRETLKNLMQFYDYDFSAFISIDVEDNGLYSPYAYLDDYWIDAAHRFPYLIKRAGRYAGFALVRRIETEDRHYFSIAEFFIMKKYRKNAIGRQVAVRLFDLHEGDWEVFQLESNKPARIFWTKVIGDYSGGAFTERFEEGKSIQDFVSRRLADG
ncbi:GNAT family N-acetyltransferase [Paenibacillus rhizovicinus]|uniref:GNAT family N-acetyltransferase n=1 Tax=Paenibacillus rhizovicinus TaxID=2704463 RepID=A0A6C0P6Y9_9BACL|nr:GNAT family N-acetyltransferase [Paenibacillus rhizovicinus]QHW34288.1 GNAT family N-acetyltransferase [Paenibacillus rhizovicinus]